MKKPRTVKINVTLDKKTLAMLDALTAHYGTTRGKLLGRLAKQGK